MNTGWQHSINEQVKPPDAAYFYYINSIFSMVHPFQGFSTVLGNKRCCQYLPVNYDEFPSLSTTVTWHSCQTGLRNRRGEMACRGNLLKCCKVLRAENTCVWRGRWPGSWRCHPGAPPPAQSKSTTCHQFNSHDHHDTWRDHPSKRSPARNTDTTSCRSLERCNIFSASSSINQSQGLVRNRHRNSKLARVCTSGVFFFFF